MTKRKAPKPPPYKEKLVIGDLVEISNSCPLEHLQGTHGIIVSNKYTGAWSVFCQYDVQKRSITDRYIRKVNLHDG